MTEFCHEHSGCLKDISNLKSENKVQWESINRMGDKVDNLMTRLNVILSGIVVAIVLLLVNIGIKI